MTQPLKSAPETGPKVEIKKAKDSEQSVAGKLLIELGPLLVFFGVNAVSGIFVGTAAFMVATLIALGLAWWLYRKVPVMPIVSAGLVLAFGGLTLYLHDDTFIKLKPTIVYTMFAVLLIGGLVARKPVLALLFGPVFNLTDEGWRKLTIRWAIFFVAMAILNEFVWRSFSTDTWVSFKAFGFLPITFVFAMSQVPLMQRYGVGENSQHH
ncbi:septation protein A [Methyloceanibacter methanicus]|uniref:septation protein A n=1 Tax=Methyloceanibacter methanicus TaxID=1774968 RepID=UPI0009F18931|nr:septation protein A [Methyloceanibacter methanicus]